MFSIKRFLLVIFISLASLSAYHTIDYNGVRFVKDSLLYKFDFKHKGKYKLSLCSWNIENFGKKKIEDKFVRRVLVSVVSKYDLITIQEYRSKKDYIKKFVLILNKKSGKRYKYLISDRVGRTKRKEQFVVIYDSSKVEIISSVTYEDKGDDFRRDPFIFFARTKDKGFDFVIVSVHLDYKDPSKEINSLREVILYSYNKYKDMDILICGDFNTDDVSIKNIMKKNFFVDISKMGFVVELPKKTNLVQTKQYDNIIFYKVTTKEYVDGDVLKYNVLMKIKNPDKVSDHLPVYALFSYNKDDD